MLFKKLEMKIIVSKKYVKNHIIYLYIYAYTFYAYTYHIYEYTFYFLPSKMLSRNARRRVNENIFLRNISLKRTSKSKSIYAYDYISNMIIGS